MDFFKRLSGDDFFLMILGIIVIATLGWRWFQKKEKTINKLPVISGDELNHFFPKVDNKHQLEFSQEKAGFSLAYLLRENIIVAKLSISDTNGYPKARDKYLTTEAKVLSYPALSKQINSRSILLDNRFQINVTSVNDAFSFADVGASIKQFNFVGLSQYSNNTGIEIKGVAEKIEDHD